jgi:23S rRNA (adenine2030-N6)-methyltransferase
VANIYFGNVGDVWKHLLLVEVLGIERPARYWESHAGSAFYPLTRSPDRDFGVYTFLDRADSLPALRTSTYRRLLQTMPSDGGYPLRRCIRRPPRLPCWCLATRLPISSAM